MRNHTSGMACGLALKRPHGNDFDAFLSDDSCEVKRARTAVHCSPFRAQMGTIAANLPSTSVFAQSAHQDSPFTSIKGNRFTPEQLAAYLRSEIKSLRRRKIIPKRLMDGVDENGDRNEYRTPKSPSQSGSDSEGECSTEKKKEVYEKLSEKPQFSLKQVQAIMERLMKEQEMVLRREYETVLNQRLDEQHQQYVQFAEDQLQMRSKEREAMNNHEFSYLS